MTEPIVFISNQRIKEGKLEEYREYYRQVAAQAEASKPGTAAHLAYLNDAGTEVSVVHIFPDADAMAAHMQGVDELARKASEYMDIVSFDIYGRPSDAVLEGMKAIAGREIAVNLKPDRVGGYIRIHSE